MDVSVVIPAYSDERWELTCSAVDSVMLQTLQPGEIIICVDHNRPLFERFRDRWHDVTGGPPVKVIESAHAGHQGASRTTATEVASGALVAFLDDDATAEPDWLDRLLAGLSDPSVVAVGGAPLPVYSKPRPRWFPFEFDWVFGCAYVGLPLTTAPVRHVIGTTMAARRADLVEIGFFHSDDFDDLDMCHRLLNHFPGSTILYEPGAVVHHFVHANRLTWRYFTYRCFSVNRLKVEALHNMGDAGNLDAEVSFARRSLTRGLGRELVQLLKGDTGAGLRMVALVFGFALAGSGYVFGKVEWSLRHRR